jgi:disulfide bond formation protein DsbB
MWYHSTTVCDVGTICLLHGSDHCSVYSTFVSRVAVLLCGPKINMVLTLRSGPSFVWNWTGPEKVNCWCKARIKCGVLSCCPDVEIARGCFGRQTEEYSNVGNVTRTRGLCVLWNLTGMEITPVCVGTFLGCVSTNFKRDFSLPPRW